MSHVVDIHPVAFLATVKVDCYISVVRIREPIRHELKVTTTARIAYHHQRLLFLFCIFRRLLEHSLRSKVSTNGRKQNAFQRHYSGNLSIVS